MVIVFTLSLLSNVMAQNEAKNRTRSIPFEDFIVDDSVNRYSLGINTQFGLETLFRPFNTANVDLLLRKQVGKYNAVRYGFNYTSRYYSQSTDEESSFKSNYYTVGVAAGYEWQTLLSYRWKWYYGADLGIATTVEKRTTDINNETYINRSNGYSTNLLPFIGFRYNITPYFFLSTEFKLDVEYNFLKEQRESTNQSGPFNDTITNGLSVNLRPYSGIFIHYIF